MPISRHYRGAGSKVERAIRKTYGKNWKKVFYATENKLRARNPGELDKHEDLQEDELLVNAMVALTMLEHKLEMSAEDENQEFLDYIREANEAVADAAELVTEEFTVEEDESE